MELDVKDDGIAATLRWPLKELQLVFPQLELDTNYHSLLQRQGAFLQAYLLGHIRIDDTLGRPWTIQIQDTHVDEDEQPLTGKFYELRFTLWLQPPAGSSCRHFTMRYSAIMHQLVTHKLFLKVRHDWYGALHDKDSADADLGVLSVNTVTDEIPPVVINLAGGSTWNGFASMVQLGTRHIRDGLDHLLFLVVLLLSAPLAACHGKWAEFGGMRYSLVRLLKIVTAFTIGHSVSLALGALKIVSLPAQPVEIAIAVTILITAVHAIRPLFFRKEVYVALLFGLVHGLAFSTILADMELDPRQLAWSILGFNLGIELMQLFILLCIVPWLTLLSNTPAYAPIRLAGATLSIVAASAWMLERASLRPNLVTRGLESFATYAKYGILLLMVVAIIASLWQRRQGRTASF